MKRKCNLHKYDEMKIEGMANYAAPRIAPAEGFGPLPRIFLLFGPPKRIFMLFLAIFCYFVVLWQVKVSIEEEKK